VRWIVLLVNTQLAIDRRETIDMVFFTEGRLVRWIVLLVNTQLAIDRRETIDMVFFTEGKYRPERSNSNGRQVSAAAYERRSLFHIIIPLPLRRCKF
jgi:hypothetical protein